MMARARKRIRRARRIRRRRVVQASPPPRRTRCARVISLAPSPTVFGVRHRRYRRDRQAFRAIFSPLRKTPLPRASADSSRKRLRRAADRDGRNPSKKNRSMGNGDADSAAVSELGPGIGTTLTPSPLTRRTSSNPGSEMSGVPASDISATLWPRWRRSSSCSDRPPSLWSCSDNNRSGLAPMCANSTPLRLVSSAATIATVLRTSTARNVMSSRFPIGVATTNSVPIDRCSDMTNSRVRLLAFSLLDHSDHRRMRGHANVESNDHVCVDRATAIRRACCGNPNDPRPTKPPGCASNAAEAFRASGDTQQATAALEGIDPARLDASNQFVYYNTRALIAIDARNYPAASAGAVACRSYRRGVAKRLGADGGGSRRSRTALRGRGDQSDDLHVLTARGRRSAIHDHRRAHLVRREPHSVGSHQRIGQSNAERERRGVVATGRRAAAQLRPRRRANRDQRLAPRSSRSSRVTLAA